jgi:hypothetical protein
MTSRTLRFPILISPLWRYLLLPFGATAERSFAALKDGELQVRFGRLFDHHFPLEEIESVSLGHWPVWAGVGWRANFRGTVGLIGTYVNVVEIQFKEPQRVRMLVPVRCERLYLSVEEPHEFISAVTKRLTVEAKAA